MNGKIILWSHTGQKAVHDSRGVQIDTVEVDTGMKRIYHVTGDGGDEAGRQIGFLHPNGFMHFVIPAPPKEFEQWVKSEVSGYHRLRSRGRRHHHL